MIVNNCMVGNDNDENNNPEFPPLTPEEIKDLKKTERLRKDFEKLNPRTKKNKLSDKELGRIYSTVSSFLSEYLDNYALVGYDTTENVFVIWNAPTQMQHRSLMHLVKEFVETREEMETPD